ncbi:MAG: hypothetical protein HYU64_15180 [Armatimonadetes bacterium]|nr:hypothetical protein [Armatimonadota bacterium]
MGSASPIKKISGNWQNEGKSPVPSPGTVSTPAGGIPSRADFAGGESLVVSPLGQKAGGGAATYDVAGDIYLKSLPPETFQNSEKARSALLDSNIPESRRKLLSNALRSIPGDHLTMLNMDGVSIKVEDKGKHYAHYRKKDSSIYVSEPMMRDLEDPARRQYAEGALRHEVGHALVDSTILREGAHASAFVEYLDRDSVVDPANGEPTARRRGTVEQTTRRNKGALKVNDEQEEKLTDTYGDLFSPYPEERNRLGKNHSEEVRLWAQSLHRVSAAGKKTPITSIVKDYKENPHYQVTIARWAPPPPKSSLYGMLEKLYAAVEERYKQIHQYYQNYAQSADLDDDPWGHWR